MKDVYVFGDSHWRVYFPFVNHGSPGVTHEQDGIRTIDMVSNELSGATMYGLLNENSKNGARRRILGDLDRLGPVENVGLVFGEVDGRYPQHHDRYFRPDGSLMTHEVIRLVARYRRFIEEDLRASKRVTGEVFVYHGFAYPKGENTLLQPSHPMGQQAFERAEALNRAVGVWMRELLRDVAVVICPPIILHSWVSEDGVHLVPAEVYPHVLKRMSLYLDPPLPVKRELPL